jgi:hypothetical protein
VEAGSVRSVFVARATANGVEALFQKFDAQQVLVKKRTLIWFNDFYKKPDGGGLSIMDRLVAVHSAGRLYFRSDFYVKRFLDMSARYAEATDAQVRELAESDLFEGDVDLGQFDKQMRGRVAMILEDKVLETVSPAELRTTAKKFGLTLKLRGGKLVLPEDKKTLKAMIKILADEYYQGELSKLHYQTNSKRKL